MIAAAGLVLLLASAGNWHNQGQSTKRFQLRAADAADVLTRLKGEQSPPFTFLLFPSDVVGFQDCPQAFQLTYDGALNSGFGEFQLLVGQEAQRAPGSNEPPDIRLKTPIDVRLKMLLDDYLPIPSLNFEQEGIKFEVTYFAAPYNLDPRQNLVGFVKVIASNPSPTRREALLEARFAPRGEKNRAAMPCREWYRDRFMDDRMWRLSSRGMSERNIVTRSDHLLFVRPTPSDGDFLDGPAGQFGALYRVALEPGRQSEYVFKVPFVPVSLKRKAEVDKVVNADPETTLLRVKEYWKGLFARAAKFELPETKVTNTVKASLAYLLIARDVLEDGKSFMTTVNKFQYHDFYFRDGAYIKQAFDFMGLPKTARESVQYYFETNPDGSARDLKRIGVDDWGQSLWAIGAHFRITGDMAFANYAYPALAPHMGFFLDRIAEDPLHLWPKCGPYDNELLDGHYTGHSFWVLLGLREAINLAKATGHTQDAATWQGWHDAYRKRFLVQLDKITKLTGGYIPPGIDKPEDGRDWENATGGVYPFGVLPKTDPRVATTLRTVREYKWREGISTWGTNAWMVKMRQQQGLDADPGTLHHYQTYNTTETELACGMQREVLEDLYSILAHTSATHAGFELGTGPWGSRDVGDNYTPHGWFAARTIELVRNMLVREEGDTLHLASCLSPQWLQPGKEVRVTSAPTRFGPVSYTILSRKDGAEVDLKTSWRLKPKALIFHIPYFVKLQSAKVDGKPVKQIGDAIPIISSSPHPIINLKWRWLEHPDLSYARAVAIWKQKDKDRRPEVDRNFLFPHPTAPKLDVPMQAFLDSAEVKLVNTSVKGVVRFTLDGSEPKATSPKVGSSTKVSKTTTVKAVCFWPDGRKSEPLVTTLRKVGFANIEMAPGAPVPGLQCDLYIGTFAKLPDFGSLQPARALTVKEFGLDEANPRQEMYALRQTGVIEIPKDGVYRFWTGSDDGSRLWIGDKLVVDNDGLHAYTEVQSDIALRKGRYPITVGFFEAGGAHYLRVFWQGPGFQRQGIPAASLGH